MSRRLRIAFQLSGSMKSSGRPIGRKRTKPENAGSSSFLAKVAPWRLHPEAKAAGPDGEPCGPHTAGELQRLHVRVTGAVHIGKESHELEDVQAGLVLPDTTYVRYHNRRAEWKRDRQTLMPVPRKELAKLSGLHVRSIKAILNTDRLPYLRHQRNLHEIAEKLRRQGT
jgi:hypothetical protein